MNASKVTAQILMPLLVIAGEWIVWEKQDISSFPAGRADSATTWTPISAWETRAECYGAVERVLHKWKVESDVMTTETRRRMIIESIGDNVQNVRTFNCFPDTVNPRDPTQ